MTQETIHEEERAGYTIKIYPDYDYQDTPDKWGDDGMFLVAFHRDFTVERDGFGVETMRAVMNKGKDEDDEKDERAMEILHDYHVFGLEAYIHSGVSLALSQGGNYPDRRWDVSQLGVVMVSKKEFRLRKTAHAQALELLKSWNACLSGSVYGFVVEKDGEHVDSCWGFVETEYPIEKTYVLAEARSTADWNYKDSLKKHVAKRKEQIQKHVPLYARTALA